MGEYEKKVPSAQEVIAALQEEVAPGKDRVVDGWLEDKRKLEEATKSQN